MANKVTIKPNASDLDLQATNNQVIVDGQTLDPNSVGVNITNQQLDLQTPPANEIVINEDTRNITITNNKTGASVNLTQETSRVVNITTPGPKGDPGATGTSGTSGSSGTSGEIGSSGTSGTSGSSSTSGSSGTAGSSGSSGSSGTNGNTAGLQYELDAIAAVIIGGASFFGGRGTVLGVFAGVMIMGILRNGLNLMNVSVFWQQVLIGSIIILAVYIDVLRRQLATRT